MFETTHRTSLRGMPGVYGNYGHARFFGLVLQKGAQLPKGPGVQPSLPFSLAGAGALTDVCEVLNNDSSPRLNRLNNTPTQNVVTVPVEAQLLTSQLSQVAAGRLGSFGLQGSFQPEVASISILPTTLAQESAFGRDGGVIKAQVHTNNLLTRREIYGGQRDNDVQPKTTFAINKVCRRGWVAYILERVRRYGKTNTHPALRSSKIRLLLRPINLVGVEVVTRGTQLRTRLRDTATLLLSGKRALDGFGSLDTRLDNKVRDKTRCTGFHRVVGSVMQAHAVPFIVTPPVFAHSIERLGELGKGLFERTRLFRRGLELEPHGSIHALVYHMCGVFAT